MLIRSPAVLVAALSLAGGALAFSQPASAGDYTIERDPVVVESHNRSAIIFMPRDSGAEEGQPSTRDGVRQGGPLSSVVVESNNRRSIIFLPRDIAGESSMNAGERRGGTGSSTKDEQGEKVEMVPVRADMAP